MIFENVEGDRCMRMSIRHSLTTFASLFFAVLLLSCGSNGGGNGSSSNTSSHAAVEEIHSSVDTGSRNPLVGVWVSGGYSLIFKTDNTYSRDFKHDDIPAVLGSTTVSGNVIIVTDDSDGHYSCVNSPTRQIMSGSYTYTINGNTLIFDRVHDPCVDRAAFLGLVYTRQ